MPLPKTLKEMKFLLFPLIAIPLAVLVAFNSPARKAHEALMTDQSSGIASIQPRDDSMLNVAATFLVEVDATTDQRLVLFKSPSTPCDNLMGPGWHEGRLQNTAGQELFRICWRQYGHFETAWDGAHYERAIVAICPLVDGIGRYMGCQNAPADRFEWQPR
jgi:hypothetical protein